jgi:hypothetical protein
MVLREGVETVIFLAAVNLTTDALLAFVGGLAGTRARGRLRRRVRARHGAHRPGAASSRSPPSSCSCSPPSSSSADCTSSGSAGTIPIGSREMRLIGPIVKNDILVIVSLLALPLIFLLVPGRGERQKAAQALTLEGPERRLALSKIQRERSWRTAFAVIGIVIIGSLGVSWAFTRLPRRSIPRSSWARRLGDVVRIPKAGLDDGHLHRFGVPIGKTVVRFFVMKSGTSWFPRSTPARCAAPTATSRRRARSSASRAPRTSTRRPCRRAAAAIPSRSPSATSRPTSSSRWRT